MHTIKRSPMICTYSYIIVQRTSFYLTLYLVLTTYFINIIKDKIIKDIIKA